MWIVYNPLVAFIVNLCLLAFLLQFVTEGIEIFKELYVDEKNAVSHDMVLLNTQKKQMEHLDKSAAGSQKSDPM